MRHQCPFYFGKASPFTECQKQACAWWITKSVDAEEGECAVKSLVLDLDEIVDELNKEKY